MQDFLVYRKNRGNVLVKMTDSLQSLGSTFTMNQRNFEFEQVRDYCTSLCEKLSAIGKINHRIRKERQGMYKHLYVFKCNQIDSYLTDTYI